MAERQADGLILFGITGDLARKRLFPALYALAEEGEADVPIVGVGRTDGDDSDLVGWAEEALTESGLKVDAEVFESLARRLCYVQGDYRDAATYRSIKERIGDAACVVAYLAVPPALFDDVVHGLAEASMHHEGRLVVEKPFGRDTKSAHALNEIIGRFYPEQQVFRIDHFLGKEAVQNLMVYRFANTILEPVWNRHYIRGVQITLAEDFDVEGRGSFYDSVGAMRDVVQNHILEMVALLAMEPPVSDTPDALRAERVKVLSAAEAFDPGGVVRGQYAGFEDEPGVETGSDTETFFAARLEIDSWRWAGVPWIIRAGKGLAETVTEAVVEFHSPPRLLFAAGSARPGPNRLRFQSKPDDTITLSMRAKEPGPDLVSQRVDLTTGDDHGTDPGQDAYHRLLGDALSGDQSLFARVDGVMEAWRIVQPVLDASPPVVPYRRGTWGPSQADSLLGGDWKWLT